jgi:hypothetical protein
LVKGEGGGEGDARLHPHAQRRRLRRVPQSSPVKGEENCCLFSYFKALPSEYGVYGLISKAFELLTCRNFDIVHHIRDKFNF